MESWEKTKERFAALWEREITDRCCIAVTAPKKGSGCVPEKLPDRDEDKVKFWTDGEWILKRNMERFENTYYAGDAFPVLWLNLGAAGHAGYFRGARYQFEDTVWFFPSVHDLEQDVLEFAPDGLLYRKTLELAEYFANESRGRFMVSMPDTSGNLDVLAHLRGTENILMDMVTDEERVLESLGKVQEVWKRTNREVFDIVRKSNDGGSCIGWLNTWAPGLHAQMQCDISVMLSPDYFNRYAVPELEEQASFLQYPLYHFDGVEQIRHLDMLLSVDKLRMIQWTCVAGQPSPLEYIDVLKRIQHAGKGLLLIVKPKEAEVLLQQLSSKGLYLVVHADSEGEADAIVKLAERCTHE